MVFAVTLLLAAAVVSASTSRPLWTRDLVRKHAHEQVPRGWEQLDTPVADDHTITLQIGLTQSNFDGLVNELYQVSDPSHSRYGKHLSKEQVESYVAPHKNTLSIVDEWLASHSVDLSAVSRSPAKDWVSLTVPVSVAERIAGAKYSVFRNKESGKHVVRSMEYSIPRALTSHIDTIQPTTFFGFRDMEKHSFVQGKVVEEKVAATHAPAVDSALGALAAVPASCNTTITPSCLRTLYNTINYTPTSKNVTIGIAGYLDEYANTADLQTFYKKYRTDAVGTSYTTVQINGGGNDQSQPGVEANLDVQYVLGVAYPLKATYYSTGGSPPYIPDSNTPTNTNEPYLDWLNYLATLTTLPQVFSTSYGDDEQTVPLDYATRVCNTFATIGARGSSILFSSGDGGVGSGTCKTNTSPSATKFIPTFPGACPYITSVGGTYKVTPERAVSFSQGGFSNYFARPSYQSTQVQTFLTAQGTTYSQYYNASGRGFPDVAAQGSGFAVVVGGTTESVGGTSASCPTFAGVVGLLNDYRASQGKASLGFLNPWLYSSGYKGLNDITAGSNPGCGTNGFTARAGWDPVTGLGTPDFVKLQALLP